MKKLVPLLLIALLSCFQVAKASQDTNSNEIKNISYKISTYEKVIRSEIDKKNLAINNLLQNEKIIEGGIKNSDQNKTAKNHNFSEGEPAILTLELEEIVETLDRHNNVWNNSKHKIEQTRFI